MAASVAVKRLGRCWRRGVEWTEEGGGQLAEGGRGKKERMTMKQEEDAVRRCGHHEGGRQ